VDKASAYPGETVTFNHTIRNNGPSPANFWYGGRYSYDGFAAIQEGYQDIWAAGIPTGGAAYQTHPMVVPATTVPTLCERVHMNWPTSYVPAIGYSNPACVAIKQPTSTCSLMINPDNLSPQQQFNVTASLSYNEAAALASARNTGGKLYLRIKNSSGAYIYNAYPAATTSGVVWKATVNNLGPTNAAGVFTVEYGVEGGSGAKVCPSQNFMVLNYPYYSVNGGDAVAGASFASPSGSTITPCSSAITNNNAGMASWNSKASPYSGAGTEYAALALGKIQEFSTSQGHSPPTALSFANTANVNAGSGLFGGMFGSFKNCIDYWGTKPNLSTLPAVTSGNLNNVNAGNYKYSSATPLNISTSLIKTGSQITIYVDGNVRITGNITYQNSNGASSWASESIIPSLRLVVHGSIFIDSSVTQLDGTYVAIPDTGYTTAANSFTLPRAGTITTCSNASGASFDPNGAVSNGYATTCNKKLTVNGSFVANQIWLLRASGTVGNDAAEVFNYGPEVWLAPSSSKTFDPGYQSIKGLPPIL